MEAKISAVRYARENNIPLLGICQGLEAIVLEYARTNAKILGATSTEFMSDTKYPLFYKPLTKKDEYGQDQILRRGAYNCQIAQGTKLYNAYGKEEISERHRHSYEFNNQYKDQLEKAGLVFSGINKEFNYVEAVEVSDHKFMVGVWFHPEFKSRPNRPHELYMNFMAQLK